MTNKQFLLLLFCSGILFRAVEPEFRSHVATPSSQVVQKPTQGSISITDIIEEPLKDKTQKVVFITMDIENAAPQVVDFTGYFSLYRAHLSDKKEQKFPPNAYKIGTSSFNLTENFIDVFKDRPFGPGEKRSVTMAFSIPNKVKPAEVSIPTQNGDIRLPLTE